MANAFIIFVFSSILAICFQIHELAELVSLGAVINFYAAGLDAFFYRYQLTEYNNYLLRDFAKAHFQFLSHKWVFQYVLGNFCLFGLLLGAVIKYSSRPLLWYHWLMVVLCLIVLSITIMALVCYQSYNNNNVYQVDVRASIDILSC